MSTNPQVNYHVQEGHIQSFQEPSKTVPGQSMTVIEIMRKFASGVPPTIQKNPVYDAIDEKTDLSFDAYDPTFAGDFDYSDLDANRNTIQRLKSDLDKHKSDLESLKSKEKAAQAKKDAEDLKAYRSGLSKDKKDQDKKD